MMMMNFGSRLPFAIRRVVGSPPGQWLMVDGCASPAAAVPGPLSSVVQSPAASASVSGARRRRLRAAAVSRRLWQRTRWQHLFDVELRDCALGQQAGAPPEAVEGMRSHEVQLPARTPLEIEAAGTRSHVVQLLAKTSLEIEAGTRSHVVQLQTVPAEVQERVTGSCKPPASRSHHQRQRERRMSLMVGHQSHHLRLCMLLNQGSSYRMEVSKGTFHGVGGLTSR